MALQTLGELIIPDVRTSVTFQSYLLDAAGEKKAFIIAIPKSGTVSKIGFKTGTVTTSQTLRVSLQTVDAATGNPTGTLYGGSTAGTQASPASNTYYTVSFGTGATAVKGNIVAVVIEFDSTIGNLNIDTVATIYANSFPYCNHYTTSWTKNTNIPLVALEYSDGSYADCGGYPTSAVTYLSWNSGSTPDERALRFSLPFPSRLKGVWFRGSVAGNMDIVLYQGTTVLISQSIDKDQTNQSGRYNKFYFNTTYNLAANTVYRLSLKPTTVTNISVFTEFSFASQAILDSIDGGQQFYYSYRTDAGAWTDDTTKRYFMGLILDQFDDGTAVGGGGIVYGGLMGSLAALFFRKLYY